MQALTDSDRVRTVVSPPGQGEHGCWLLPEE